MTNQLYLKPEEGKFLAMCVVGTIEQLRNANTNPKQNWNPQARAYIKDMLKAGEALKIKLVRLGFNMTDLPPYMDGDEEEFLTKES